MVKKKYEAPDMEALEFYMDEALLVKVSTEVDAEVTQDEEGGYL